MIKILSGKFGADHCDQLPATSRCQSRLLAIPPGGITRTTPGSRERVKYSILLLFFLSIFVFVCLCFSSRHHLVHKKVFFLRETSQMLNIFVSSVHLLCFFWGHQSTYTKYHIYLGSHKGLCCVRSIFLGIVRNPFPEVGFVLLLSVTFCQLLQTYCPRSFFHSRHSRQCYDLQLE